METVSALPLWVIKTDFLDYEAAWHLQQELWRSRRDGKADDMLLLLQHPPAITLGRGGDEKNLLLGKMELQSLGIGLHFTDRGGDITYHGPGQLIGYPIVCLPDHNMSPGYFITMLEEVIILTLQELGVHAKRVPRLIGVWVGDKKVSSLGVRIRKGVTTHGFAFNINNDLTPFQYIHPCGIKGLQLTSLMEILGKEVDFEYVEDRVIENFVRVFKMQISDVSNLEHTLPCAPK